MSCWTGSRSKGSAKKILLRRADLNPTAAGHSNDGKAAAILPNTGSKTASSLGVHWKDSFQKDDEQAEKITYFSVLNSAQSFSQIG